MLIQSASAHRNLWIWSGDSTALQNAAWHYIACSSAQTILWLGDTTQSAELLEPKARLADMSNARRELGGEFELVIADVTQQFDSDAIAAISGTIIGGGHLVLLTPDLHTWADADDWHLHRFISLLLRDTRPCTINDLWPIPYADAIEQKIDASSLRYRRLASVPTRNAQQNSISSLAEQEELVAQFSSLISSGAHEVSLLTADRGRGKSAALGLLLARLQSVDGELSPRRILVSAPSRRATDILYQHYGQHHADKRPEYYPPDQLLEQTADLLIVDEAASIPLALLRKFVGHFKQVIFASTVHGYEGGGRGFALRFAQLLQRDGIRVEHFTLHHPIRWLPQDPLEVFSHSAFLLEAPLPPTPDRWTGDCSDLHFELVQREYLATHESQLAQIYGLLVQAHYRTTPNDLRYMLANSSLRTFVLRWKQQIVAAALVTDEGPVTNIDLRQDILAKQRRPAGHRLPQLLAQYTLMAAGMDLRCARIVRIAVHPELQSQGIGSEFLTQLRAYYQAQGYDLIGAMFGAVPDTVRFWQRNEFVGWHLGFRPQTSSGYRSLSVACCLGHKASVVLERARLLFEDTQRFRTDDTSDGEIVVATHTQAAHLYDPALLLRYCAGQRSFHDSHAALARLNRHSVPESQTDLLHYCANPSTTIRSLARDTNATSQALLEAKLRQQVGSRLASLPIATDIQVTKADTTISFDGNTTIADAGRIS